ncbi:MAG: YtxH domain-containing protein [Ignavibacteriales bacterium]|nr:YtxH domain-containing protein [Ignavibacteriales bacterium]
MSREQQDGMGKGLIVGFLVGGIAGAITALLLAPKSGRELREDIKQKSGELKDKAKTIISDTAQKAKSVFDKGEEVYEESSDIVEGAIATTTKFTDAVRAGYEAFKDERNRS